MRYLFFDIECCDGYHICEFGYVIVDEKFRILEKKDLVINPEERFDLHGKRMQNRIELFYSEEEYKAGETFPYYYHTIKSLLEDKEKVVLGHSLLNDAKFLKIACNKYNKRPINFDFYDTQKIYAELISPGKSVSLEKAKASLNIVDHGVLHKSDDDAESTMMFVKEICQKVNSSLNELITISQNCKGFSNDYDIGYYETSLPKILEYAKTNPNKISQAKKEKTFMQLATNKKHKTIVSFANGILKNHFADMLKIAKYLNSKGYTFTKKVSESNVFIKYDEYDEQGNLQECMRLKSAESKLKENKEMTIFNYSAFIQSIGLTETDINKLPFPLEDEFHLHEDKGKRQHSHNYMESKSGVSLGELLKSKGIVIESDVIIKTAN